MSAIVTLFDRLKAEFPDKEIHLSVPVYQSTGYWFLDLTDPTHWVSGIWSQVTKKFAFEKLSSRSIVFGLPNELVVPDLDSDRVIEFVHKAFNSPSSYEGKDSEETLFLEVALLGSQASQSRHSHPDRTRRFLDEIEILLIEPRLLQEEDRAKRLAARTPV